MHARNGDAVENNIERRKREKGHRGDAPVFHFVDHIADFQMKDEVVSGGLW
jgi:hypothetical protein